VARQKKDKKETLKFDYYPTFFFYLTSKNFIWNQWKSDLSIYEY